MSLVTCRLRNAYEKLHARYLPGKYSIIHILIILDRELSTQEGNSQDSRCKTCRFCLMFRLACNYSAYNFYISCNVHRRLTLSSKKEYFSVCHRRKQKTGVLLFFEQLFCLFYRFLSFETEYQLVLLISSRALFTMREKTYKKNKVWRIF